MFLKRPHLIRSPFNERYIIQHRYQVHLEATCRPLRFSSWEQAYRFIIHINTGIGYWMRLAVHLGINPQEIHSAPGNLHNNDAHDCAARFMSHLFYQQKLYFYPVVDVKNDLMLKAERKYTLDNGDLYTFCHPSILMTSDTLTPVKIFDKAGAEKLLSNLMDAKNKENATNKNKPPYATLAKSLKINNAITGDENSNRQLIVDALTAGSVIIILLKKPAAPPKPVEYLPITAPAASAVIDPPAKKAPDFDVLFALKDPLGSPMKALPYIANEQSVKEKDLHLKQGVTDAAGKTPIVSNLKNEALKFYTVWAKINVNPHLFKVK